MIQAAMVAGMISSGAAIIDLSELPIPVIQYYARDHRIAGSCISRCRRLTSASADIRMFDGHGVGARQEGGAQAGEVFFREDIRRVHFIRDG